MSDERALWYLSFCDPDISPADPPEPGGPSWLGACYVLAVNEFAAVTESHLQGCNPGGEVQLVGPFSTSNVGPRWLKEWCNRLLTKDEAFNAPSPYEEVK